MANRPNRDKREKTEVLTRPKVKRPPLYRVIFHNDDYTTREFVVSVLQHFFHKSVSDATHLMLKIHHTGKGVAGVYPYDIAVTKVKQVETLSAQEEMPLRVSLEADE